MTLIISLAVLVVLVWSVVLYVRSLDADQKKKIKNRMNDVF